MEIFQELFLTVFISIGLAFLIAKLVSVASAGNVEEEILLRSEKKREGKQKEVDELDGVVVVVKEEKSFIGELRNTSLEIEKKVEFVEEPVMVEEIEGDLVTEGSSDIVHGGGEVLNEGSELVEVGAVEQKEDRKEEKEGEGEEQEQEQEQEQQVEEVKVIVLEEKYIKGSHCDKAAAAAAAEEEEEVKTSISTEDGGQEKNLVVERPEKVEIHEIGLELAKEELIVPQDEHIQVTEHENNQEIEIRAEKSETECLFTDEEDWEGIEKTEIENLFGVASTFVGSGESNELLSKLSGDVQMQLYGLHKVATEGPCYQPQPLALMVSARAKWHAWQRLGNMSPEVAMEQYTALLSENIPGWTGRVSEEVSKVDKSNDSPEDAPGIKDHNLSSYLHHQPFSKDERKPGDHSFGEGGNGTKIASMDLSCSYCFSIMIFCA